MAIEKVLNTRIQLKYDSFTNWNSINPTLKSGEVAIAYLAESHTSIENSATHPVMFKVGPGEFNSLPWASALAADVHAWAKKSEAEFKAWVKDIIDVTDIDTYSKSEIDGKLADAVAAIPQADWEQTDDTQLDYIKNRPFGSFGFEEVVMGENKTPFIQLQEGAYLYFSFGEIEPEYQYKVILNGEEYICTPQLNSKKVYCLGNVKNSFGESDNPNDWDWTEGEPFCLTAGTLTVKPPYASQYTLSIYRIQEVIKTLDKKYVNYVVGEKTANKTVFYEDKEYTCEESAEIFNDYVYNKAIGEYSHAEGTATVALGARSHAEGMSTVAKGQNTHAEGLDTIASG